MKHIAYAILGFTLLFIGIGCGGGTGDSPDLGRVSGTVLVDGKPLENVLVSFAPEDGSRASTGVTDASGQYQLTYSTSEMGAKIGKHNVKISSYNDSDPNDPNAPMVPPEIVPKDYLEISKPVEVTAGSNTIDLTYP
ncbi:carboxypeptidase-like regulatory domain-containing protein [Rubinisphaera italica]|uniref:Carboxypeptidase regulatory-like domain-containing protein n=1 Tax=Rubinisphaera italica TaxID=2527969 RepID=A0A5C5XKX3_9PLAN|nr:carboxypeptidase-like regulatory domain-containing protein [Rubinisphaera italica]TWT62392.1 hypothetical protein Pan54_31340 [Rubinisphaera italica]